MTLITFTMLCNHNHNPFIELFHCPKQKFYTCDNNSLVAETVKHLPAMQETQVRSLCLKDPLEKGMATHSSILAWRIPWTEEPGGLQSMGHKESDTTE